MSRKGTVIILQECAEQAAQVTNTGNADINRISELFSTNYEVN